MFEVLVYVYENYWQGDACPELHQLGRKLSAVGFEDDEIHQALVWLNSLNIAAQSTQIYLPSDSTCPAGMASAAALLAAPRLLDHLPSLSAGSMRVYSTLEQAHLGADGLGFVQFLESSGVLPPHMREIVIDRAMASSNEPISLDDLKIVVLMVYWSFGQEPDALVLDELCDDAAFRVAH